MRLSYRYDSFNECFKFYSWIMFLDQQFWVNWVIVRYKPLYKCLWDLQYKPWQSVLNGLKCDTPTDVLQRQIHLKQWFQCLVNNLCPIKVYEMKFSHGLITWAKFWPLKCASNLHFQNLTPPRAELICRLYFFSFRPDVHFQSFDYFSAFRHKIKWSADYHVSLLLLLLFIIIIISVGDKDVQYVEFTVIVAFYLS